MCDPLLRVYANQQQMSRKIAAGFSTEHSLLPANLKAEHESIELSTICGGLEGALGEVDMLFEDIRDESERILRHAIHSVGIGCSWAVEE